MGRLGGKVAVVSGGAAGIGRAVVERFARDGASVLIADVDRSAGEATALSLRDAGYQCAFHLHDASLVDAPGHDAESVTQAAAHIFGSVDIAVACAGVLGQPSGTPFPDTKHPDVLRLDLAAWAATWSINTTGALAFVQACARRMVEHGRGGSIVVITSIAAANPAFASNVGYAASKAALDAVVKHLAPRLAPMGIRINAVGPGITATSMSAALVDDEPRTIAALASVPMGRLAQPAEIADAVRFLASDDAAFITGESLYVDGGCFTG